MLISEMTPEPDLDKETAQKSESSTEVKDTASSDSPSPRLSDNPTQFPEGGLTAWLTVLGGTMAIFCTFGTLQSFGVYQDYYTRIHLNERTPSEISWIGTLQLFFLFAAGLPAGKLFDEGYFKHLLATGSIVYIFSTFMLSITKPHHYYQVILAQGVGMGVGMGIIFLPSLSIASHYFRARRTLAMGIVASGSSLGGIIWTIMLNHLFDGKTGFAWGVRISGFVALGMLFLANIFTKTRLPPRKLRPNAVAPDLQRIFYDVPYWICILSSLSMVLTIFFPYFYVQLFAVLHGVPENVAFYSIPIMNAGGVFGRILPNFLADYKGCLNVLIPAATAAGVLIFAMFGATSSGGLIVFALLYGFFTGAYLSLLAPMFATLSNDINEVGVRIGIACFIIAFGGLTGNPISGALLNPPLYTWSKPIIFNAVLALFGCVLLTIARHLISKKKGTQCL